VSNRQLLVSCTINAVQHVTLMEVHGSLQGGPDSSIKAIKGAGGKGMILPFTPMALTFHKVCYYVPLPKVLPPHPLVIVKKSCLSSTEQLTQCGTHNTNSSGIFTGIK
jgi:hypothetical protein